MSIDLAGLVLYQDAFTDQFHTLPLKIKGRIESLIKVSGEIMNILCMVWHLLFYVSQLNVSGWCNVLLICAGLKRLRKSLQCPGLSDLPYI